MNDMMMPPDPSDPSRQPSPEEIARREELGKKIEAAEAPLRHLGLYIQGAMVDKIPVHDPIFGDQEKEAIALICMVGEAAWDDRVQNPEKDDIEAEFRKMQTTTERETFEEKRQKIQEALDNGDDILGMLNPDEE